MNKIMISCFTFLTMAFSCNAYAVPSECAFCKSLTNRADFLNCIDTCLIKPTETQSTILKMEARKAGWETSSEQNPMDDTVINFILKDASNTIRPVRKPITPKIAVWGKEKRVFFIFDEGYIAPPNKIIDVRLRIDKNKVKTYQMYVAENMCTGGIVNQKDLVKEMVAGKKLLLELTIQNGGTHIAEFDISALRNIIKWCDQ